MRLAILLFSFAAYLVLSSQFWWLIKLSCLIYIVVAFISIYANPIPYPQVTELIFLKDEWHLFDQHGVEIAYQKHRVLLDIGLFFLLELRNLNQRKVLVIFSDQLSQDAYRSLRLIEKLR